MKAQSINVTIHIASDGSIQGYPPGHPRREAYAALLHDEYLARCARAEKALRTYARAVASARALGDLMDEKDDFPGLD